jgi:hypothetical protein
MGDSNIMKVAAAGLRGFWRERNPTYMIAPDRPMQSASGNVLFIVLAYPRNAQGSLFHEPKVDEGGGCERVLQNE